MAIQKRAEQLIMNSEDEKFDVAISRAVTSLMQITPMALPLIKNNGTIIAMKGDKKNTDAEIEDLKRYMSSSTEFSKKYKLNIHTETYLLPEHTNERCIVIIRSQLQNVI